MRTTWDYIIVGAGSAGATLAARLSEQRDRQVLLLEAGGWDTSPRIQIPGLLETVLSDRDLNWAYQGAPDATLDGRELTWAAGRVVGGSSSINGMVYGRGLPADYDRWVAAGNPGWGWRDMLPYFIGMEHWTGPAHPARGSGGPLSVRRFAETDAACASVMTALIALGVPPVEDYCTGIVEGVGLTQATQKAGRRHSVAGAYLRPAGRRPNLTCLTRSRALGLLFDGARCVGVRTLRRGRIVEFRADREVIVCAGAIGTPKLLLQSGIGPADHLAAFGLPVVHHAPGVGAHMNDHVNIRLSAVVEHKTYNTRRRGLALVREAVAFALARSGAATSPANHVQAFVRTAPGAASADVQLQVMPYGFGDKAQMALDGLTVVVSPCQPEARGVVSLASADPLAPPRIRMRMLDTASDRDTLLRGCKLAVDAIRGAPGRTMGARIYEPSEVPQNDADWLAFFRRNAGLNWHPTSTCRMGPGDDDVVDQALRVRGVTGLSLADASVMPFVTSANTNAPVIAIAERAAGLIAARTR
jgi:choline dehydrogenase